MQADGGREVTAQHGQEVKSIPKWGLHASRAVATDFGKPGAGGSLGSRLAGWWGASRRGGDLREPDTGGLQGCSAGGWGTWNPKALLWLRAGSVFWALGG